MQINPYLTRPLYLVGLFQPAECQQIIAQALAGPGQQARVALPAEAGQALNTQIRKTTSYALEALPQNLWIIERLQMFCQASNEQYYHFQLSQLSQLQILLYRPGGLYDWHLDLGQGLNSTRKLSLVVFLSAAEDYDGGRLEIESSERELDQNQGDAVIFPAYLRHRVAEVRRGQRWSLVVWAHGRPFV